MKLSIYHDGQFFVGLVEFTESNRSKFIRYVFGQDPNYDEIHWFINNRLLSCIEETNTTIDIKKINKKINRKRLQRQVSREQKQRKWLTKADEAIKVQQELNKKKRKVIDKERRDVLKEKKRRIKKLKAKEKHKGH
ncbi:DUF2992 family protein [Staphylococcus agnetis]|uniref:DUF2992 family protein n=1 Tax=Staphylococcus agnetis TaxID=985762 RepID=UPI000D02B314|nr:DUF2992 family protein [Staphylococcus agnetis]